MLVTVQDLIDRLNELTPEQKQLPVGSYSPNNGVRAIRSVDNYCENRIDLNLDFVPLREESIFN